MSLVIVSNRLPIGVKKEDGKLVYFPGPGGLASGLSSYAKRPGTKWIGWPGMPSDDLTKQDREAITAHLRKHNCYPVFLTQAQLDGFYNGYANRFLWPLFHDLPIAKSAFPHENTYWKAYQEVNKTYAKQVLELSPAGNTIWVHDYQLQLLPELLRAERPDDKIGFFLHIPFPTASEFTKLRHGKALVQGMLGSDLVGFHITSYCANFLDTVQHYKLGQTGPDRVETSERTVRVTDFPIGIDYEKWRGAGRLWAVRREQARLRRKYLGKKVILTVERLDPTKAFMERVTAYQTLLRQNPKFHGKVQLVMIAVPSRGDIEEYRKLRQDVEQLIADINQEFGTPRWKPVEYRSLSLGFEQLRAHYNRADIAFITPLRDGMNLVAKEYLASKPNNDGVLVLSSTAGAAQELHEAVLVNPRDPESMVHGLKQALNMSKPLYKKRVLRMHRVLKTSTIHTWAGGFMESLRAPIPLPVAAEQTVPLTKQTTEQIVANYRIAIRRLLLLDYDGVLAKIAPTPDAAKPTDEVKKLLQQLAATPGTEVVIVSGRDRANLDDWLGGVGLNFAAEHGAFTRVAKNKTWRKTPTAATKGWQLLVRPILQAYADITPGAHVERKSTALVWHYRQAKPYYAQKNLVVLRRLLKPLADSLGLSVKQGHKMLEVKPADIHKGIVARDWLERRPDFVLAIGDDYTDEDMFKNLPSSAYSLKVGHGKTAAMYRVRSVNAVIDLLKKL